MFTRQRTAAVVFLSFSAIAVCASGQMKFAEITVPPYDMYHFKVPAGEPVLFVPMQPLDLRTEQFALKDGGYVCGFPTGPPGIIYVDAHRNGPPGGYPVHVRLKVLVEGDAPPIPDPDDPPEPDPLTGLAQQVYESAIAVNRPAESLKFSQIYSSVASAIAAGGIKSLEAAHQEITRQNRDLSPVHQDWKSTFDLVIRALNKYGQTLAGTKNTLTDIAKGLERAGK